MATTQNKFPSIRKGTSFNGRDIKLYNGTGATKTPMSLNGVALEMNFRNSEDGDIIFSFKTANNTITITGVGLARMMPRLMIVSKNKYLADLVLTFPNGSVKSYGRIYWEIN